METLPLSDIIITIDTREQNQKRIKAVETWGIAQGAIVEHSKLDLCDYRILGTFRDHEINIGIEAKGLSDFCSCDYEDLKRKLFDSFDLYDNVALFIESANYSFLNEGFGKSAIINSAVRDGSANVCNLAVLEGCCSTLPAYGIHVRQLRSEAQFPYSIENLLTYCIHDHSIIPKTSGLVKTYKQMMLSIATPIQVKKLIKSYPNMPWLCSASEESLKIVLGNKTGSQLYEKLHFHDLETTEWRNMHFPDGTDVLMCEYNDKLCSEVNAYDCVGKDCKLHPDFKSPDALTSNSKKVVDLSRNAVKQVDSKSYLISDQIGIVPTDSSDKIKNAIVDYLTEQSPHALTVDELCDHFNIAQGDEDKEAFLIYIKELAWEKKITNTISGELTITQSLQSRCNPAGNTFLKNNTTLVNTPKTQCPADDNNKATKVLPPITSVAIPNHKGAIQREPPLCDTDRGSSSTISICKPLKTKVPGHVQEKDLKLASSKVIESQPSSAITSDTELFGKQNPDWKVETHRMSARVQLESYLQNPHTLQECVDKFDMFTSGTVFEHIARMKREGTVIEFDDKTLVMAK